MLRSKKGKRKNLINKWEQGAVQEQGQGNRTGKNPTNKTAQVFKKKGKNI